MQCLAQAFCYQIDTANKLSLETLIPNCFTKCPESIDNKTIVIYSSTYHWLDVLWAYLNVFKINTKLLSRLGSEAVSFHYDLPESLQPDSLQTGVVEGVCFHRDAKARSRGAPDAHLNEVMAVEVLSRQKQPLKTPPHGRHRNGMVTCRLTARVNCDIIAYLRVLCALQIC